MKNSRRFRSIWSQERGAWVYRPNLRRYTQSERYRLKDDRPGLFPIFCNHEWELTKAIDGKPVEYQCVKCATERHEGGRCPWCLGLTDRFWYVSPHMTWHGCFGCWLKVADAVEEAAVKAISPDVIHE